MKQRLARGWCRLLLRLTPPHVRAEYGDEMADLVVHGVDIRSRRGDRWARPWAWLAASADLIRFGWSARRDEQRRALPGAGPTRTFAERSSHMLRTVLQDVKFGARLLVKDRSFAVTALLTLAVCIGANTAIFSIVRSVVLKPLPVPESNRLVSMHQSYPNAGSDLSSSGVPDYFDRLSQMTAFEEIALYRRSGITLGQAEGADRLTCVYATPSFLRLVRATPVKGRIFTEDEGELGREHSVMLTYDTWQRRFGTVPDIVGRSIRLGGEPYVVVGVLPKGFSYRWHDIDVWLPAAFTPKQRADEARHSNNWDMVGRLKPGATLAQVQQQLDAINARNDARFPELHQVLKDAGFHSVAMFLQDEVTRDVRPVLYLLWGGVLFVLLIGCVNIANLVVIRSSGRARELATRHAIGADRARLARQVLTETMLLAIAGGALGLFGGWWALRALATFNLDQVPRGYEIQLDAVSVAVVAGLTLVVGLLIGLLPMLRITRLNINQTLRDEGRGGTSSRGTALVRRSLAVAQVAIAMVLLIGAGLMLASFRAVLRLDPGFSPDHVLTAAIALPASSYKDPAALVTFTGRLLTSVRQAPDVTGAGVTDVLPFSGNESDSVILAEGYVMQPGESLVSPMASVSSDGYFEAMRIPLVRGRYFTAGDTATSPPVVIVDERLAKKFWPGRDPIGRRMYKPESAKDVLAITKDTKFLTVVGVVKEVQFSDPGGPAVVGGYYFPYTQSPENSMVLTMRTTDDPTLATSDLRRRVSAIDPELPVFGIKTMEDRLSDGFVGRRVPMLIASTFGVVALLLAAIGVYGVLAYGVSQRRREIGIRMALGSSARGVFRLFLGDGLRILTIGLAIGLAGGLLVGRAMERQLFQVRPSDPRVLGLVVVLLAVVAIAATLVPARRASRVNPIQALNE